MDIVPSDLLNGIGVVGLSVLFVWALMRGWIGTGRELREKEQRISALEATLRVRDHQLTLVLTEAMTVISPVLRALRDAKDAEEAP
jgi:hypothetical protein